MSRRDEKKPDSSNGGIIKKLKIEKGREVIVTCLGREERLEAHKEEV